jgi:hypothetical protein
LCKLFEDGAYAHQRLNLGPKGKAHGRNAKAANRTSRNSRPKSSGNMVSGSPGGVSEYRPAKPAPFVLLFRESPKKMHMSIQQVRWIFVAVLALSCVYEIPKIGVSAERTQRMTQDITGETNRKPTA